MSEQDAPAIGAHMPAPFLVCTPKGQAIKCKDQADCREVVESATTEFLGEYVDVYRIMTCARKPGIIGKPANDDPAPPASPSEVPRTFQAHAEATEDLVSHYRAWRDALIAMRDNTKNDADRSYWNHEITAFDRTLRILTGGRINEG